MPILRNTKWERFAVNVFQIPRSHWSVARCYTEAGYKAVGHSAEQLGSQLLRNLEVRARIEELSRPVAKKAGLSLEALTLRIGEAIDAAKADNAHGAIAQNHGLLLKIADMVRERDEAEQMQFAGASTANEILQHLIDELGPHDAIEICTVIIEAARARLADQAVVVS